MQPIIDSSIWRSNKKAFLARWTTDWDCGTPTEWWYVIQDEPFDIGKLKSKRRYEINKGLRNFDVRAITPDLYISELFEVTRAAYQSWPEKYRPAIDLDSFIANIQDIDSTRVFFYGAFSRNDAQLCGYAQVIRHADYAEFSVMRVNPEYEKLAINAALVFGVVQACSDLVKQGGYIVDGSRSISHETRFQDYLEKYFQFRKAYCRLHLAYRKPLGLIIAIIYPFKELVHRHDGGRLTHKLSGVLSMEEIARLCDSQ